MHIFGRTDQHIIAMVQHLGRLPERTARDAFFFVATFVLMFQRQSRNAFSSLLEVWARRNDNFGEFSRQFRRAEISSDMPHRETIAREIDFLNDY